jgi:hypothetical protein
MNDIEQLIAIKSQALAVILEITSRPKPSYKIDGQNILWTEYLAQLQQTVRWCDEQIAAIQPREIRSLGCS